MWWSNRSWLLQPLPCLFYSCCSPKPSKERISDGDKLFTKLLRPEAESEYAPEELRNHLFWTEDNIAHETLVSFGNWAWRRQDKENPRVIGLGTLQHGWTNNPTCFGAILARISTSFLTVKRSPDGKWIYLTGIDDPSKNGEIRGSIWIYIVQEGDVFTTPDGRVLEEVKPGDLCRLTWEGDDLYDCDNSKLTYMYFPKRVVSLDENGQLVRNQPYFDNLVGKAKAPQDKCRQTCCYTCSCCMTSEQRFEFSTNFISDEQYFSEPPIPPTGEVVDRL